MTHVFHEISVKLQQTVGLAVRETYLIMSPGASLLHHCVGSHYKPQILKLEICFMLPYFSVLGIGQTVNAVRRTFDACSDNRVKLVCCVCKMKNNLKLKADGLHSDRCGLKD